MTSEEICVKQKNVCTSPYVKKYFSIFMALYPILCIYKAFYKFTIGDIVLMLFFFISLPCPVKRDNRLTAVVFFSGYACLALCINLMFSQVTAMTYDASALFFRIIKFIFYMLCVFTCGKHFFDIKTFQKTMFIVATIACFFIIVQYAVYYGAEEIVLGRVPGLALYLDEYSIIDYNTIFSYSFRPSSFFLEPALFCQYMIVALVFALFTDAAPKDFKRVFTAILFTAGMLMSTAGQGILYIIIVGVVYGFKGIKNKAAAFCFIVLAAAAALIFYDKIEVVRYTADRLLFNESAYWARLGTYKYVFELNGFPAVFGYGYGATPNAEYLAGAAYVWYGCGLIGLLLSLGIFGLFYRQSGNIMAKTICMIFFVMFFGTGLFYNYMLCWYFTLILCTSSFKGDFNDEYSLYTRCL